MALVAPKQLQSNCKATATATVLCSCCWPAYFAASGFFCACCSTTLAVRLQHRLGITCKPVDSSSKGGTVHEPLALTVFATNPMHPAVLCCAVLCHACRGEVPGCGLRDWRAAARDCAVLWVTHHRYASPALGVLDGTNARICSSARWGRQSCCTCHVLATSHCGAVCRLLEANQVDAVAAAADSPAHVLHQCCCDQALMHVCVLLLQV